MYGWHCKMIGSEQAMRRTHAQVVDAEAEELMERMEELGTLAKSGATASRLPTRGRQRRRRVTAPGPTSGAAAVTPAR